MIAEHLEHCDVLQLAPDGGPSQKPCNCRQFLDLPTCTGISASWCPIHGDCVCDREVGDTNNEECPLHCRSSSHAMT